MRIKILVRLNRSKPVLKINVPAIGMHYAKREILAFWSLRERK